MSRGDCTHFRIRDLTDCAVGLGVQAEITLSGSQGPAQATLRRDRCSRRWSGSFLAHWVGWAAPTFTSFRTAAPVTAGGSQGG